MTAAQTLLGYHGALWFLEPMTMYAGGDGTHRRGRHCHFLSVHSLATWPSTGEDLHCKCCCDLCLEATMAHVSGERAPAFTAKELEKLVDGVLPQYTLLYGPPDKQVSAHQKKGIWRAIGKEVQTLGVFDRRSTHCRKRWEDLCRWAKKTAEAQLGLAFQRGRGARRTMTSLMFRILVVAYPELDGRLRASQQPQGGEYTLILLTLRAVEVSGWGRWAVGFPRPGRVP
ncbi:hypothetical protein NDU88_006520 [Pleurodeles waltl]|uniref:Myb/SANT-like DNA-binding domain-containing protein n=1 Tax=Pleurodeles waltl TaxID=8319 RepID=A0AAV7QJA4_PLEWA|nr:hypothetical protein NDU88_006520 [Pleurodeles waltl]